MSRRRLERLNEQLKRELAELIRVDVRDPRVGPVTVTAVQLAADYGSARVFVRVVGGPEAMAETLEGLQAASPFLRGTLGRILKLRRIPELRFQEDRSLEHARRIEEILSDVGPIAPEESDEGPTSDGEEAVEDEEETGDGGTERAP
jgi:ribosome-binding factor A